ncbi:MAG: S-layer homology domain-containing protein [Thermoanaerobaculia bacterium]
MTCFRIAAVAALLATASAAFANTYTVTSTADSGAGTLRQAILDANTNPGPDTIAFNIVGSGVHTIAPVTPLPSLTDPVTINGYSQPGASPNGNAPNQGSNAVILIEINGQNLVFSQNGLTALAPVTIRGLTINRAFNAAIAFGTGATGSVAAGNFLGTDPAGSSIPGAENFGVDIGGVSGVTIGGTAPADRNVIAGNAAANIYLNDSGGPNTIVKGNLIGLNAAGTAALAVPGPYGGIYVRVGTGVLIGGPTAADRNVISGHPQSGVVIGYTLGGTAAQGTIEGNYTGTDVTGTLPIPNAAGIFIPNSNCIVRNNVIAGNSSYGILSEGGANHVIQGNFIGTDETGTLDLGNGGGGISVAAANWTVGGTGPGQANVIAHNRGLGGVVLAAGSSVTARIRANRIFDNKPLGIDLLTFSGGVTPNDAGDPDDGPNGLQNFPIVKSVTPGNPTSNIQGVLNSAAATTFDLDLFSNPVCLPRPQDYLQGETYLGSTQVTTDGSGNATFNVDVPFVLLAGQSVTATATDPAGKTSEFSQRIIFSINPASGPPAGGSSVTITGMLFEDGATVSVGGISATNVTVVNPTSLTATMPGRPAGSLNNVTVTNPSGIAGTLLNGWVSDFLDVTSAQQFYFYITKLVANQITVGCGGGNYCPLANVTRQQMAVFLLKSKNGLCYVPPPCSGVFPDVPCSSNFAPWIEALAAAGITGGCGGGNYCPLSNVTRQQMAVFLLKSKHGSAYVPPACSGDFADVPCPSTFADWIEQLAAEGITGGCGGSNYCPAQPVRRDQMAAFLNNTFQFP